MNAFLAAEHGEGGEAVEQLATDVGDVQPLVVDVAVRGQQAVVRLPVVGHALLQRQVLQVRFANLHVMRHAPVHVLCPDAVHVVEKGLVQDVLASLVRGLFGQVDGQRGIFAVLGIHQPVQVAVGPFQEFAFEGVFVRPVPVVRPSGQGQVRLVFQPVAGILRAKVPEVGQAAYEAGGEVVRVLEGGAHPSCVVGVDGGRDEEVDAFDDVSPVVLQRRGPGRGKDAVVQRGGHQHDVHLRAVVFGNLAQVPVGLDVGPHHHGGRCR